MVKDKQMDKGNMDSKDNKDSRDSKDKDKGWDLPGEGRILD
jgi:hypothetical protein